MSSVIFIPIGEEYTEYMPGGVVNSIGNDENEELTVQKDNHQRSFLIRNDDGSLEIFNLVKRTTADLVLPDNRMSFITFVNYHKHFDKIPLKEIGLDVIIGKDLNMKDGIINTTNTIQSLQKGRSYQYTILDKDYNPIITRNNKVEISKSSKSKNIGKDLLSQVRREEIEIDDIEKGYITIVEPGKITGDWVKSALQRTINITKEDEIPLQILNQKTEEEPKEEPKEEPTEDIVMSTKD